MCMKLKDSVMVGLVKICGNKPLNFEMVFTFIFLKCQYMWNLNRLYWVFLLEKVQFGFLLDTLIVYFYVLIINN